MPRPSKTERREMQINVKLTPREFDWAKKRAVVFGLKLGEFARGQVLAERPVRTRSGAPGEQLAPLLIAHVSRLGNNLNQIARRFNQLGLAAPPDLGEVLDEIRAVIRKVSGHDS